MSFSKPIHPAVREHMAAMGSKGGKAGSSANKAKAGKAAWADLSPAERSAEMKRRAKVREQNRKGK